MAGFASHQARTSSARQQKWPRNANRVSRLLPFTLTWTFPNVSAGQRERCSSRSSSPTAARVKGVSANEHSLDRVPV